ncbi:MAG: zinc ribbon domain-containing protein, partial [Desulfatiglandales bacterium]
MESEENKKLSQKIRLLLILQSYDQSIRQKKERLKAWPSILKELDREMEEHNQELESATRSLMEVKARRKELEGKVSELESKIKKRYMQLYEVKSNKDYQEMLQEIDDLKDKKNKLEDQVLDLMEAMEEAEKRLKEIKNTVADKQKEVEKRKEALKKEMEEIGVSLKRMEAERDRLRSEVEPDLLSTYTRLMEMKGAALSPVIKGVCQACHMSIPPQKFIELLKCQTLMNCPNCERIIYWGEEEMF